MGWCDYIWLKPAAPAASYRVWIEPNKINDLAGRQINDLAHALDAYQICRKNP